MVSPSEAMFRARARRAAPRAKPPRSRRRFAAPRRARCSHAASRDNSMDRARRRLTRDKFACSEKKHG